MTSAKEGISPSEEDKEAETTLEEGFQVNMLDLINLFDSLVIKIEKQKVAPPCSRAILGIGHSYIKSRDPNELMTSFITKSQKSWDKYNTRDMKILFENIKALFPGIPDANLASIADIFSVKNSKGQVIVSEEEKESVWVYIGEFIRMAILYIHNQRSWGMKPDGKIGYRKVFFKGISVKTYADLFNVKIDGISSDVAKLTTN